MRDLSFLSQSHLGCWAAPHLLAFVVLCPTARGAATDYLAVSAEVQGTNPVSNLLQTISTRFPWTIDRDSTGSPVCIGIPSRYNDDRSLALLGSLCTVTQIVIFGGSKEWEQMSPPLTERGISFLAGMTNLTSLELACLQRLDSGVLRGVCGLTHLNRLTLYNVALPSDEYRWLAYATNLEHLEIQNCSNFGDQQLRLITTLTTLKDLRLLGTSVTPDATNGVNRMHSLTNMLLRNLGQTNDTLKR
jgi:hypothetical protein